MKKIKLLVLALTILLTNCGKDGIDGRDGRDGDVYVSFEWVGSVSYSDDIPGTPTASSINSDQNYRITPGRYSFQYVHNSLNPNVEWTYTYTYAAELGTNGTSGTDGGLFSDGIDGTDGIDGRNIYYTIGLWSDGPIVYKSYSPYKSTTNKMGYSVEEITNKLIEEKSLLNGHTGNYLLNKKE